MEKRSQNIDVFSDLQFNYAVVFFGKLSDLQRLKKILEKQDGITIRYQTLDRGKLIVKRETEE